MVVLFKILINMRYTLIILFLFFFFGFWCSNK